MQEWEHFQCPTVWLSGCCLDVVWMLCPEDDDWSVGELEGMNYVTSQRPLLRRVGLLQSRGPARVITCMNAYTSPSPITVYYRPEGRSLS